MVVSISGTSRARLKDGGDLESGESRHAAAARLPTAD